MLIREETIKDYEDVKQITYQAFKQAALSNTVTEDKLISKFRKSDLYIKELSLVIEDDNKLVGCIMLTKGKSKLVDGSFQEILVLAPMSILPNMQKQGYGSALVKESLKRAKNLGYKAVVVMGHENYYPKFGFKPAFDTFKLSESFNVPKEYFFAIEFEENYIKEGCLEFSDIFSS